MHIRNMASVLAGLVIVSPLVFVSAHAAQAPDPVAFENVTVIPMDIERRVAGQTVVVQDGRIVAMGPAKQVAIPARATRVDGTGRFLIPGLTETHGHVPAGNAPPETVERVLYLYVLNGVTTVRGMLGDAAQLEWREQAATWQRVAPRLVVAGPSFNGNSATDPVVAARMVEEQKAAGYDLLKIHPGVTRAAFDALAGTADRVGIPFAGHVPQEVGVHRAIEAGYASIDHLDGYMEALIADGAPVTPAQTGWFGLGLVDYIDRGKLTPLIQATRDAGVYVNATETLMQTMTGDGQPEAMLADPAMAWWPEDQVNNWANSVRNLQDNPATTAEQRRKYRELRFWLIRSLHEGGVTLLLGADAPQIGNVPGFSTLRELELMAEAGLSPFDALATGTRNVGQYLDEADFGTIAVGHRADLILLDADPLLDVSNVRRMAGVMANGRWIPGDEIQRRLEELRLRDELASRAELYAQAARPEGLFTSHSDIGELATPGTSSYDLEQQAYVLTGSGKNMWLDEDEFFFLWRKLSGDFILSADASFPGEGVDPHRKTGWMVRAALTPDSPYVDVALHGDGLTSLQYRRGTGNDTEEQRSPVQGADVLQLERAGGRWVMSVAKKGDPLTRTVLEGVTLPDEVYVGLFICAHNADVVERAGFSNVRISIPAPADFRPYQDYYPSRLEVMDVSTGHRRVLHTEPDAMQAPNWTPDGRALIYNRNGLLYRYDLESGAISEIDTGFADRNNNDHAISFDGRSLAISHHAADHDGDSIIYTVPVDGGTPAPVTPRGPSYLHGWSPDGHWLIYTGGRDGNYDIYKILASDTSDEVRLTEHAALDDGAEFAPDGKTIYFNSARSGRMEIWRMRSNGAAETRVTNDEYNNWFPHVSPDGSRMVYLAYGPDVAADDHPWYRQVVLVHRPVDDGESRVIANLYGGQGTINVPSWSPDGRYIAFVSN